MALEIFTNDAQTTVSTGGTTAPSPGTVETWTVASSTSFPAASSTAVPSTQFHVADIASGLTTEKILVTNVNGATWTVTRGVEGTSPVAHTAGFTIQQVATAAVYTGARVTDWLNAYRDFGADPTGVADSTSAISTALSKCPAGGVVYLPTGTYKVSAPLVVPSLVTLRGSRKFATGHLGSPVNVYGSVIQAAGTFTQGTAPTNSLISFADSTNGQRVEGLYLDGSSTVDGIGGLGGCESVSVEGVVIYGCDNGINQVTGTGSPANCDGWNLLNVFVQSCTGVGVTITGFDVTAANVHAQNSGGDNWYVTGRNNRFTACRGDVSAAGYGFHFASAYSSSSNDTNVMTGCGTQFNALAAVLADTGNTAGLVINGGMFDGDGTSIAGSNPQAAVLVKGGWVTGWWNTLVTSGFPLYALATVAAGSAVFITTDGGAWNAVTGPVSDAQGLAQAIAIGPMTRYSSASGSALTAGSARFTVTGAMTSGSVTVSNPWITATSRIIYSRKTAGGTLGSLSISAQSAGSVTFASSSSTETSTIEFMILSQ